MALFSHFYLVCAIFIFQTSPKRKKLFFTFKPKKPFSGGLFIEIERVKKVAVPLGPPTCCLAIGPLFQIAVFNE